MDRGFGLGIRINDWGLGIGIEDWDEDLEFLDYSSIAKQLLF